MRIFLAVIAICIVVWLAFNWQDWTHGGQAVPDVDNIENYDPEATQTTETPTPPSPTN